MGKKKEEAFVLDGSLTLAWYFKDEADPYADSVLAKIANAKPVVPSIWRLEIANAILMGERRGRSTEAQATKWLGFLSSLPIAIDTETTRYAWTDTLTLSRRHGLTAYDASYLELALRQRVALATLDVRLKKAASSAGVKEFRP